MRFFAFLILAVFLGTSAAGAQGTPSAKQGAEVPAAQKVLSPAEQLDSLYARLQAAKDSEEGAGILRMINRLHSLSPSPTASLLMDRAERLVEDNDLPLASEMMERVLLLAPQWTEAWMHRAALFRMTDDIDRAAAVLLKALSLEPRYIEALEMLGDLYAAGGDDKKALVAYRKALALYPASEELQEIVRKLALSAEGKAL